MDPFPRDEHNVEESWQAIIAGLEADVARSEGLARERSRPAPAPDALAPSELRLPDNTELPAMPSPAAMPAVPTEVAARIRGLQSRIDELTRELADELAALRPALASLNQPRHRLSAGLEPPVRPHFFDGRA